MKGTVSHRDRKNPRSADAFQKEREKQNRARGKQVWVGGSIKEGGHWERTTAGN
jgi:hypothetical protein